MQRLGLMRIMKRQRMKYESIYPVTIYHKTIPWIYNLCHFLSFRDRIIEKNSDFFIMRITNGSTANGRAENKRRSFHLA